MFSTTSTPLVLLAAVIGIAIGLVIGWAAATARAAQAASSGRDATSLARADAAQWRARAEELSARALQAEERAERDGAVLRALAPVRSQLEVMSRRVEEMERSRAEQHATLSEQLRVGADTERRLVETTSALASALRSRSSRGMWGEVELARILEASGMMPHVDFSEQRSVGALVAQRSGSRRRSPDAPAGSPGTRTDRAQAASRPDVVIHLPGQAYLALDAKAPMDAYLRACEADEPAERAALLTEHGKALRGHVDALAKRRYDRALGSGPQTVVLFVPAEPVLAAALEADPSLLEHAVSRGVALTSPASLLPLLRVCATAWAQAQVADDAGELLAIGRTLYERLGVVASHLDALGTALSRSVAAYNRTVASVESRLLVTARSLAAMDDPGHVSPVDPDAAQVRTFSSAELRAPEAP